MTRTRPVSGSIFLPNALFIMIAFALFFVFCILYIPIMLRLRKKGIAITRQLSYLALFGSVYLVVFATILFVPIVNMFTPFNFSFTSYLNLAPFGWLRERNVKTQIIYEVIPNIMLFVPLGIFIPAVFIKARKMFKIVLAVFLLSALIEFFQYFLSRTADIDDIIKNTLGGTIGYGIFKMANRLFVKKAWWNKFIGNNAETRS